MPLSEELLGALVGLVPGDASPLGTLAQGRRGVAIGEANGVGIAKLLFLASRVEFRSYYWAGI